MCVCVCVLSNLESTIFGMSCFFSSLYFLLHPSLASFSFDTMNSDEPIVEKATDDLDLVLRNACRAALKKGLVSDPDDLLVVTAGLPFGTPGAANVVRIVPAAGPSCWNGVCLAD